MYKNIKEAISASKDQTVLMIKGIILGMGIIIPGVSGGTIMVIFGMYEKLLEDILAFNIRPYIGMALGTLFGVFLGSFIFSYLFEFHRNPTSAFILGCLLMSIPFILKRAKGYAATEVSLFIFGAVLAFFLVDIPALINGASLSVGQIFLGGFVASSTMMIPGVSGSAMLVILGMYEDILNIINELQFVNLGIFVLGAAAGVVILANVLNRLFSRHESRILFFFSGLILGSSRLLLPSEPGLTSVIAFLIGVGLVYKWGKVK